MMFLCRPLLSILVCKLLISPLYAQSPSQSWESQKQSGWHWYKGGEEPLEKDRKQIKREKKEVSQGEGQSDPYTKLNKNWKRTFEESKARAIYEPTYQNIVEFQKLHREMMDRSLTFGKQWVAVNLREGLLDYPEANPNPAHRRVLKEYQETALQMQVKGLKEQGYGLFFLTRQECGYCQVFAPVVLEFSREFNIDVLEISRGRGSGYFKQVPDNGIGDTLNPEASYPLLYLMNTATKEAYPLAKGNTSLSGLKENMKVVLESIQKGDSR